jgi:ribosomal protein S18 acetylase RimI-like enzyme
VVNPHPQESHLYRAHLFELPARESISVLPMSSDHVLAFRALRLDALRRHPEAFVPTWDDERHIEPSVVAARFRNDWTSDGSFILGAFGDGRLVGAVGVRRWPREKQRHRATMWILYTDPSFRGRGIGRRLLDDAIAQCRLMPDLEVLQLSVSTESRAARRMYVDAGFRSCGVEPKALRLPDRYVDVEMMVLDLEPFADA